MEIVNLPQDLKKKVEEVLANRQVYGEYIIGMVEQSLADAANHNEFLDMISNDFESHINDMRKIEAYLKA
jgi:hypothetical protein